MKGADFEALAMFLAVAAHQSFIRAARQHGVSATAASRRIAALEDRLGTRLLNRTTRSVSLTEAGTMLVADLAPAVAGLDAACRRVAGHDREPHGRLRINLPRIAAQKVVMPILPAFTRRYPRVAVDLVIDDHLRDVVAGGFDAGIRLGAMVQKHMTAVRLTPDFRMAVVASPAYLKGRAHPAVPADLLDHRCLTYRFAESGLIQPWLFDGEGGAVRVEPNSILSANDTDSLLKAALDGLGIAYLADLLVSEHTAAGRLVMMLAAWCAPFAGFHLYHPGRRLTPAPLRAFIDFVREQRGVSARSPMGKA